MNRQQIKVMRLIWVYLAYFTLGMTVSAQNDSSNTANTTTYKTEIAGSVASESQTPFWLVSNHYGVVPLEANNGYLKAGVFHDQTFGKGFRWGAGLDLVAAVPRHRNFYIQQVYAEIGYKCLQLSRSSQRD